MGEESERDRVEALARHLLREGHVDNEAEARLAAIEIILVQDASSDVSDAAAG